MDTPDLNVLVSFNEDLVAAREFFFCPHKYVQFFGGIRNAKTTTACKKILTLCMVFPGNVALIGRDTYPNLMDTTAKIFFEEVSKLNGAPGNKPGLVVERYDASPSKETLYFKNGSIVRFRYLMKFENVQGSEYGCFYIDEADAVPEETYDMLESRLTWWNPQRIKDFKRRFESWHKEQFGEFIPPRMCGMTTGNPHPGWVKKRFKEHTGKIYHLFESTTESNRKNLPPRYIEEMRESHDEDWCARFLDNSWDVFKGQVYKDYNRAVHVIKPFVIPKNWTWLVCLDYGSTNPTAVYWLAIDEEGNVFTVKEFYKGDSTVELNAPEIKKIFKILEDQGAKFEKDPEGKYIIYADKSTLSKVEDVSKADLYDKHGITLIAANSGAKADVEAGIEVVKSYLRVKTDHKHPLTGEMGAPRFYIFEGECPSLEWEFPLYEYIPVKEGEKKNRKEEPRKFQDHAMDSIRYGLITINDFKTKSPEKVKPLDRHAIITANAFKDEKEKPRDDWMAEIFGGVEGD